MPAAPLPRNEPQRLEALCNAAILDTGSDFFFDECADAIRHLTSAPIMFVSFVDEDRQWLKTAHGLRISQTPRGCAICAYTILTDEPLIVSDVRADERFCDNALVTGAPHIVAYLGAPIILGPGIRLGAVCAVDTKPRAWDPIEIKSVADAARLIASYLKLRRQLLQLNRQRYLDVALHGDCVPG